MLEMERLINSTLESRPNLSEVFSIYPAFRYRSLDRESSSRHLRIKSKNQENQHKRLMRLIHISLFLYQVDLFSMGKSAFMTGIAIANSMVGSSMIILPLKFNQYGILINIFFVVISYWISYSSPEWWVLLWSCLQPSCCQTSSARCGAYGAKACVAILMTDFG